MCLKYAFLMKYIYMPVSSDDGHDSEVHTLKFELQIKKNLLHKRMDKRQHLKRSITDKIQVKQVR